MAADEALMERADSLLAGGGYIGREKAEQVADQVPEAPARIIDWLGSAAGHGNWRRFERLAAAAVHMCPEGLASILVRVLASGTTGVNTEDLVDMLGELRAPEAVEVISGIVAARRDSDGPYFSLCVKGIQALAEIGSPDALSFLNDIAASTSGEWPAPLRWHAAEQLGIDEELGFDEDEMLGGA
jgi:hypothetical protein